jgi:hypothetical protein
MTELEYITPEEARQRLLVAYREAGDGEFVSGLKRPMLNPIEQRDERGLRKIHPLLIVTLTLLLVGAASIVFFSLQ